MYCRDENHTYIGNVLVFGIFVIDVILVSRAMCTVNLAFIAGSSKQGKALLAEIDWNCVDATRLKLVVDKCSKS